VSHDLVDDLVVVPSWSVFRCFANDPRFRNAVFAVSEPVNLEGLRVKDVWIHTACFSTPRWDECAAILQHLMDFALIRGEVYHFD
jgi:hypothetical protein